MVRRPSMAVVTVTAGVRMPSASSAAPPIIAGMMSHLPQRFTRLYRAKMPPSLWLSAFMATRTYLTVVMSVIVQMMSDSAPMTTSWLIVVRPPLPLMMALSVYIGLVPMSPYTTPSVTRIIAADSGMPPLGERFLEAVLSAVWETPMFVSLLETGACAPCLWNRVGPGLPRVAGRSLHSERAPVRMQRLLGPD